MGTFDERIEALTMRHNAMTRSLRLSLADSRQEVEQRERDGDKMRALAERLQALVRVAERRAGI